MLALFLLLLALCYTNHITSFGFKKLVFVLKMIND